MSAPFVVWSHTDRGDDVARILDVPVVAELPQHGDGPPGVLVVDDAEEVGVLFTHSRPGLAAVIGWSLPESAMERLYELDMPVFAGLPTRQEVIDAIEQPDDAATRQSKQALASRLAALEALLQIEAQQRNDQ